MIQLREIYVRWIGIPILSLIATFVMKEHYQSLQLTFFEKFFQSFVFTAIYWNGAYLIFRYFRQKFPEISHTTKRIIYTLIVLSIWMFIGGMPAKIIFEYAIIKDLFTLKTYTDWAEFNFLFALIVGMLYEIVYFFEKWKQTIRLAEELKNQQVRTQLEVLQNQMSPHFLFNSLNALTTLIAEDQQTAIDFTQKLSEVYRYILQNKDKELVRLEEELDFAQSYVYLLQMRYPSNLIVEFNIKESEKTKHIAPLTLQMLIENAIKHNIVSKSNPLKVLVYINEEQAVVVENNLQLKSTIQKSTKTGLINIKKRYSYLINKEIAIISNAEMFKVAVPLINLVKEKDFALQTNL